MIRKIWHTLTHIGITDELDSREARRVSYVNYITILFMLYLTIRGIIILPNVSYSLILFSLNILCASALTLNYFHRHIAAKLVMFCTLIPAAVLITYFLAGGPSGGVWVAMLSGIPVPFVVFDLKQKVPLLVCIVTVLTGIATVFILDYVHPLPPNPELNIKVIRLSAAALSSLILLLCTWHFYSSYIADEEKLLEEKARAEAANRAKSIFLANMSHELRTPLNAILGFSQLMGRDPAATSAQRGNLEVIGRSGEHLLHLIDDVLTMSRIEAGRVDLDVRPFDLYGTLGNIDSMLRLRAEAKSLSFQIQRDANVPQYVKTDQVKLSQILVNLLGNSVKFTQEGAVILRVGYESPRPDGPSISVLLFEVEDTGIGIAATETDGIFDPFVQAESGRSSQDGTGLGLAITRQFVQLMGGDISVTSEVGKGTTFSFHIEIELATAEDLAAEARFREVIGLSHDQPEFRILIVEDNPQNRDLLVKMLQPLGLQIREAVNGQEGIEISEAWEPNLIFMDMRMPVMDGFEATRRIKSDPKGKKTKIVAVTASVFEHEQELVMEAGCDDFIRKPIRSEEIFETLSKHLGVKFRFAESADEVTEQIQKLSDEDVREHLRALPPEWVSRLNEAAVAADIEKTSALIGEIRDRNRALADTLCALLKQYRLDKIVGYTE